MRTVGLEDEIRAMTNLYQKADEVASKSLYVGAGIMADAYKQAINSIPTGKNRFVGPNDPPRNATQAEKNAVARGLGISSFRHNDDSVNASIGIGTGGYAENIRTKKYPNGKPVPLIANGINSGSSYMKKYPFARKAEAAAKAKAIAAVEAEAKRLLDEVTK